MQEFTHKTEAMDPGLTTADLANLDEPTSTAQEVHQNREKGRGPGSDHVDSQWRHFSDAEESAAADSQNISTANTTKSDIGPTSNGTPGSNIVAGPAARSAIDDNSQNETAPLFSAAEAKTFHSRWDAIQVSFVDEPRQAVQQADGLVANAIKRLAEIFAEERGNLDQQWDRGDDVSTEDLRVALRRYRSFFGRLLSV